MYFGLRGHGQCRSHKARIKPSERKSKLKTPVQSSRNIKRYAEIRRLRVSRTKQR